MPQIREGSQEQAKLYPHPRGKSVMFEPIHTWITRQGRSRGAHYAYKRLLTPTFLLVVERSLQEGTFAICE
jgi:hypothetical protein